jgi:hypothetical protein
MSKNLEERQRCSDRIMNGFIEKYPGLVSKNVIKLASYYTECNRGYYYRDIDTAKSNNHYWKSIKINPLGISGYRGLFRNLLKM